MTEFGRFDVNLNAKGDSAERKKRVEDARKELTKNQQEAANADRLAGQIFERQEQRVAKSNASNKNLQKSTNDVNAADQRSIELKQQLIKLQRDYEKIQEERGRKSSIRSKKELQSTIDEATILKEILAINEELGTRNDRLEKRYAKLKASIESYTDKLQKAVSEETNLADATETVTKATEKKTATSKKATEATRELADETSQLSLNLENLINSTGDVDKAEEQLDNNREHRTRRQEARDKKAAGRGGGGGKKMPPVDGGGGGDGPSGPVGPGPSGGDEDFEWDKYLEKIRERIKQLIVEQGSAEGRRARELADELRQLDKREQFARRANELELQRGYALQKISILQRELEKEVAGSRSYQKIEAALAKVSSRIVDANRALSAGTGNADALAEALQKAGFESSLVLDKAEQERLTRQETLRAQRDYLDTKIDELKKAADGLEFEQSTLRTVSARKQTEDKINETLKLRRALFLQINSSNELSNREFERLQLKVSSLQESFKEIGIQVRGDDDLYVDLVNRARETYEARLVALRRLREEASDPSVIRSLVSEINSAERTLDQLNRKFSDGRGTVEGLTDLLAGAGFRAEQLLDTTEKQNEAYINNRKEAEKFTRGLNTDIRTQRLILDQELARTENLKARAILQRALNELAGLEERRRRDIDKGDFSDQQALALQVETQRIFRRNIRDREEAIELEGDYNLKLLGTKDTLVEIESLLSRRDPLFKGGLSTNEIDKLEIALAKLKDELQDVADTGGSIDGLSRKIERFRRDVQSSIVPLNRFELALEKLRNRFGFLDRIFGKLDASTRGFSLFTTLATLAVEPLAAVVLQLAGGLVAVSSAAIGAASALGGALVAGASQALPVLILLGAGFKSLIDVVQLSNRQRQDEASNLAREARGVGGVADATDKLKDSQQGLVEAQRRLSDSRRQAIRDLEDLADKEKQAELASRSASISVAEAQITLDQARSTGSALDIRRAEIELSGARISESQSERDLGRVRFDSSRTKRQGVEGNEQVVSAKRALAQAERQLTEARIGGASATNALSQATARLDEQIKQLSPGQRELLENINDLRKVFRTGPFAEIRDIILQPFNGAVKALKDIGKDSGVTGSFTALANSISEVLGSAVDKIFGPSSKDFIKFINGEAAGNLQILGEGFGAIGSILARIAIDAAPLFRDVLTSLTETFQRIDRSFARNGLKTFFDNTQKSLDAFSSATEESFLLRKNLFELSSPAGNTLVSTFATFIRGINQQLANPQKRREITDWFNQVGKGVAAFGTAFVDLGKAIFVGLDENRLRQFSTFLSDVVAPAIRSLIIVSGVFADALALIGKLPLASELGAIILATVVLGKTFATVQGLAGGLKTGIVALGTSISNFGKITTTVSGKQGLAGLTSVLTYSNGALVDTSKGAGRAAGALGKLGGARVAMAGLGRVVGALGPIGLAAGIGLTLFGDVLLDLLPKVQSVEDRAKAATRALADLASITGENDVTNLDKREADAAIRSALLRKKEADASVAQARKDLANARDPQKRGEASRRLESALIEQTNAQTGIERADDNLNKVVQRIGENAAKTEKAVKAAAKATAAVFADEEFKILASGPKGGVTFVEQTKEERRKDLRRLLGDDEDFQALEDYTQGKIQSILEMIIAQKGSIPPSQLELVYTAIADNKSFAEIAKTIGLKLPKNYNLDVEFNQKKLAKEATDASTTIDKLFLSKIDRINNLVAAQSRTDADRGRPIQGFADGGIIPAQRGGRVVRVAEDGYDEYVITTDPTKKQRSKTLLERAARSLQLPNGTDKEYGKSEGDPPSLRGKNRGGSVAIPSARNPLAAFFTMFKSARRLDDLDIPYSWGGGHTTPARPTRGISSDGKDGTDIVGLDCSSSVSAVLQSASPGFPTITSGDFPSQAGMAPGRGLVTVWSNNKHVFMSFGNEDWGTNSGEPGNGPGFHNHSKAGYTATHPKSLGAKNADSSVFGSVYRSLAGADLESMSSFDSEFSGLGRSARSFKPSSKNLFDSAASAVLGNAFKNFQQFANGGDVPGKPNQMVPIMAHGGEMVLDVETAKRLRSGTGSKELVQGFLTAISSAIKGTTGDIRKMFQSAFSTVGIRTGDTSSEKGMQRGLLNNITVDNKPDKKGGISRFNILDAALQALQPGGKDEDYKAVVGTTNKRIKSALDKISDRFAGFLDRVRAASQGFIDTAQRQISDSSDALAVTQQSNSGSFNSATGLFQFSGDAKSQAFDSVADVRAERASLVGQRDNLVAARAGIQGLINSTTDTLAGLKAKQSALYSARAGLVAQRDQIKPPNKAKKTKKINELISAVDLELESIAGQITSTESTIVKLNEDLGGVNADITSNAGAIAATQGAEIDALISQATNGRYSPEGAKTFLDEAEKLATDSNDQTRLDQIRRARFNLGQSQAGAELGLAQAELRAAERSGNEGERRSAIEEIGRVLATQQSSTQEEMARLIAEGMDPNSQEIIALRTRLVELGIAIQENTEALTGTTTQNFSSTAWQLFRRAIFGGENQILPGFSQSVNNATVSTQVVASAAVGAMVMSDGLLYAHKGEKIVPAAVSRNLGDMSTQNISVTVNEAQQSADPTYLAKRLAFELAGR